MTRLCDACRLRLQEEHDGAIFASAIVGAVAGHAEENITLNTSLEDRNFAKFADFPATAAPLASVFNGGQYPIEVAVFLGPRSA